MRYWIGLDIGGTKIAAHLVDELNQARWQTQTATAKGQDLFAAVCVVIDNALTTLNHSVDQLVGIGLGIPGKVVPETGEIHLAVNLDIESPLPIGPQLHARYGTAVHIENDVRLGAVGVQHLLGFESVAYISIGTGLAAGLILDGKLYRGKNGLAGEIGHIIETYPDGSEMILENIVSGPGLLSQARKEQCEVSNPAELFTLANSGDMAAKKVLDQFFYHLARAIQWVLLTFDVDQIVLGGGITHIDGLFESYLRTAVAKLRERSKVANLLLTDDKLTVLPKSYNAGLWGATFLVKEKMVGLEK